MWRKRKPTQFTFGCECSRTHVEQHRTQRQGQHPSTPTAAKTEGDSVWWFWLRAVAGLATFLPGVWFSVRFPMPVREGYAFPLSGKPEWRRAMPTPIVTCVGGLRPPPLAKRNARGGGLCPPPSLQPARRRAMPTPAGTWIGGLCPPPLANHTVRGGGLRTPSQPSSKNKTEEGDAHPHCYVWGGPADPPS